MKMDCGQPNHLLASSTETHGAARAILPLHVLYPVISVPWYKQININGNYNQRLSHAMNSIHEKGMVNPVVVLVTTAAEWQQRYEASSKGSNGREFMMPPNIEGEIYQVMCGCKRLYIAKMDGYTHIDCLVTKDLDLVSNICKQQRISRKEIDKS